METFDAIFKRRSIRKYKDTDVPKEIVEKIAQKAEYLDLHKSNVFMDEYSKAMFLPHTELDRFN